MTSTTHIALTVSRPLTAGLAERAGLALLSWADHRRAAGPRTVDPGRVPSGHASARPFC